METKKHLVFRVTRQLPELITPAKPTPHEYKFLSDIDDQRGLRCHVSVIQMYNTKNDSADPVKVIREALSKILVFYYPFAGRLRENAGRKLAVDCTGEGVLFIEADADVALNDFGDELQPPFPCIDELLFNVPGSDGIVNCPLLFIQVTRLKCGGFIFGLRFNHTMADAAGIVQFIFGLSEIARGANAPSVLPVWQRELFNARELPCIRYPHPEYDEKASNEGTVIPISDNMVHRSFFFGPSEIHALRQLCPPHIGKFTSFEVLTAFIWRARIRALQVHPQEEVRLLCSTDARTIFNPPLQGYYGNAFVYRVAITTAGYLCQNPIEYALKLVMKTREDIKEKYMRSVADLMVLKGRPHFTVTGTYFVANVTRAGLDYVDFGWGRPVYGGPAKFIFGAKPEVEGMASYYIATKNSKGEKGIAVALCLPASAMENFAADIVRMFKNNNSLTVIDNTSPHIKSAI